MDLDSVLDNGDEIEKLMRPLHLLLLTQAADDAETTLGIDGLFNLDNPFVQDELRNLATLVRRVADTTKDEIRALVGRQAAEGWSVTQLADEIEKLGEIRSVSRAQMIARTESGTGYNLGSVVAYRTAGLTHVDVLDGDEDEPCKSANGSRWTLDEARANPLGHPNCIRAFAPVVE